MDSMAPVPAPLLIAIRVTGIEVPAAVFGNGSVPPSRSGRMLLVSGSTYAKEMLEAAVAAVRLPEMDRPETSIRYVPFYEPACVGAKTIPKRTDCPEATVAGRAGVPLSRKPFPATAIDETVPAPVP